MMSVVGKLLFEEEGFVKVIWHGGETDISLGRRQDGKLIVSPDICDVLEELNGHYVRVRIEELSDKRAAGS